MLFGAQIVHIQVLLSYEHSHVGCLLIATLHTWKACHMLLLAMRAKHCPSKWLLSQLTWDHSCRGAWCSPFPYPNNPSYGSVLCRLQQSCKQRPTMTRVCCCTYLELCVGTVLQR
jgi:hypothetical protein